MIIRKEKRQSIFSFDNPKYLKVIFWNFVSEEQIYWLLDGLHRDIFSCNINSFPNSWEFYFWTKTNMESCLAGFAQQSWEKS